MLKSFISATDRLREVCSFSDLAYFDKDDLFLTDKRLMSQTGKIIMTCDLARRYGILDVDGKFEFALLCIFIF